MKYYKIFLMKVWKKCLLILVPLALLAGLLSYRNFGEGENDLQKEPQLAEPEGKDSPAISGDGEQREKASAFIPVLAAVADFYEDSLRLMAEESDESALAEKNMKFQREFADEIIDRVEKVLFSPQMAELSRDEKPEDGGENKIIEGKVEKGDTISSILEKSASGSVQHYISAAKKIFSLNSFKAGQPYTVHIEPESGRIQRFEYEINNNRKLVVEGGEKPRARLEDIAYTTLLDSAESLIGDNLFKAVADIGESPQLALRLVKLFGSEINFARNLDSDDSFSVLIEKRYKDGEYRGYGRIIAATFTNRGKTYEAYLFRNGKGAETYYNAKGENLNKTLLQSPLAITRVTSRFTHRRFHPILRENRPHLGVDYGAPTGTPVKAVGDGVVSERGWAGGYGNQIVIRHGAGLESLYSHLSGYARGLRVGERVKQGEVIGFVGSTGRSTGPHLDFRLRQKGQFIDPAKAINPRGMPVAAANMKAFEAARDKARACLRGEKIFENYTVDSIVPLKVKFVEEEIILQDKPKKMRHERYRGKRRNFDRMGAVSRRAAKLAARRRR